MERLKEELRELLPLKQLEEMSGEEIVGSVAMDMYRTEFATVRAGGPELPQLLRDMMLIIDLDTELTMEGISGYLENTAGLQLAETIAAMQRIGHEEDAAILDQIRGMLSAAGVTPEQLRANVNEMQEHDVASFQQTHGQVIGDLMQQVQEEAEKLSLLVDNEGAFERLFDYAEANKAQLKQELEQILSK